MSERAKKLVERLHGENTYMGYEGDVAWFWEYVRDHGWGAIEDEARELLDLYRQAVNQLESDLAVERARVRELEEVLREIDAVTDWHDAESAVSDKLKLRRHRACEIGETR